MPSLLLQTSAPFVNILLSAGLAIVVGIVGWLLNRTIGSFDTSIKDTKEVVKALTNLFTELRGEMKDGHRLVDYLEKRVDVLGQKKKRWKKSSPRWTKSSTAKSSTNARTLNLLLMAPTPTPPQKGWRILLMVALAAAIFLLAPPALRWLNPAAGAFDVGTLNAPVLAALQFFAAVSMAYVPWRFLFPGLYAYVRDCMEGKLLENVTADLLAQLPQGNGLTFPPDVQLAAERRRIAQFQFTIRCVRLLFCLLPFFAFLALAQAFLNTALTVVPH